MAWRRGEGWVDRSSRVTRTDPLKSFLCVHLCSCGCVTMALAAFSCFTCFASPPQQTPSVEHTATTPFPLPRLPLSIITPRPGHTAPTTLSPPSLRVHFTTRHWRASPSRIDRCQTSVCPAVGSRFERSTVRRACRAARVARGGGKTCVLRGARGQESTGKEGSQPSRSSGKRARI